MYLKYMNPLHSLFWLMLLLFHFSPVEQIYSGELLWSFDMTPVVSDDFLATWLHNIFPASDTIAK